MKKADVVGIENSDLLDELYEKLIMIKFPGRYARDFFLWTGWNCATFDIKKVNCMKNIKEQ